MRDLGESSRTKSHICGETIFLHLDGLEHCPCEYANANGTQMLQATQDRFYALLLFLM